MSLNIFPGVVTIEDGNKVVSMVYGPREQDPYEVTYENGSYQYNKTNPNYVRDCTIRYNSDYSEFFSAIEEGATIYDLNVVEENLVNGKTLPPMAKERLERLVENGKARHATVIYIA